MTAPLLEIEAAGAPREIGLAIGEAARELIVSGIAEYRLYHEQMDGPPFDEAVALCTPYLEAARRWLPAVVEELEGMAEGAGLPLGDLLVPNLGEELTCNEDPGLAMNGPGQAHAEHPEHCTSVGVRSGGHRALGHNEDWWALDAKRNVLLRLTTADGTRIIAVTSAGLLPPSGMNSHGIATAGNTVYANDSRIGVPNNMIRRHVLEAKSREDARARALQGARARGSNHIFADQTTFFDIETSGTASAESGDDELLVHTNHFLSPAMAPYEISTSKGTRWRVERARQLLAEGVARGEDARDLVARVLADHATPGEDWYTICSHADMTEPPGQQECTTASMVWDLDELTVDVSSGPPCENERRRYALR